MAAAAEASRSSSNGSVDSYIGSLISLTSKSEIRYEGLLFNINAEESSIGLSNVRSFGTEGRKKDGLQVPPSDKVYEYILFRGSDIKDLQVKSSPTLQATPPVYDDPAIIQTHYPQTTNPSVSLPSSSTGSIPDLSAHNPQIGLPRPTIPGSLPLYQPLGGLGSWGSPPSIPTTNGSAVAPMYWQGYYGSSNGFQPQQQSLFRPPPGLLVPSPLQQMTQQSTMSTLLPTGTSSMAAIKSSESSSALLPPLSMATPALQSSIFPAQSPSLSMTTLNLQSHMLPTQHSIMVSDTSTNLIPNKVSTEALAVAASSLSFPFISPLTNSLEKPTIQPPVSDEPITVPNSKMPVKASESSSVAVTSSSILNEGAKPTLITPGQLLQLGPSTVSSTQPPQTSQKDAEVVQVSSSELLSSQVGSDAQKPILPLPSPADYKPHASHTNPHYNNRGGHQRGRGNRMSRPVTRFTEDFDFTAMNEKFNKDEVWGDLGKTSKALDDGNESQDEDDAGSSNPVYVKDDFFDALSCDALDRGSQSGRTRFSEQRRKDAETFGFMPRHGGGRGGYGAGRGGQGYGRGGRSNGAYYGRGYGHVGRGRGHNYPGRGT
ncbi:Lsm14- DFDF- FFD- domain containing protein [Trema orientale]|uniref:Lsm14-DFDF-FFD-domain containing protein n=1 Tax=Trema orientale TaxID=63057 RepID=A0A2P5F6U0_TREOI|nr:Lsm14- DFDF- FFD- domain containing protein [Trema orientale]